jgi:hypothetical protein
MQNHEDLNNIEQLYRLREIARFWHISPGVIRRIFKNRPGIVNVSSPGGNRPSFRVPASVVIEVMVERGYSLEQAAAILRRPAANGKTK